MYFIMLYSDVNERGQRNSMFKIIVFLVGLFLLAGFIDRNDTISKKVKAVLSIGFLACMIAHGLLLTNPIIVACEVVFSFFVIAGSFVNHSRRYAGDEDGPIAADRVEKVYVAFTAFAVLFNFVSMTL